MATKISQEEYDAVIANTQPQSTSVAERMMQEAQAERRQIDPLNPAALLYRGVVDPALEMTGGAANVGVDVLQFLSDTFGSGELSRELQDRVDSRGGPGDLINNFRQEMEDALKIEDPKTRAEIANETLVEYGDGLTKFGVFTLLGQRIPGFKLIAKPFLREVRKRPGLVAGSELAGAVTETELEYRGYGETAQAIGGGFTAVGSPTFYNKIKRTLVLPEAGQYVKQYGKKNYQRATEILQSIASEDPEKTARTMMNIPGSEAPLEIITGDEGFTFFEVALAAAAQRDVQLTLRNQGYLRRLADVFGERANVKTAADLVRHEEKRLRLAIEATSDLNITKSMQRLARLGNDVTSEMISLSQRDAVNETFLQVKRLEDEAWAAVDLSGSAFKYPNARKALEELKNTIAKPKLKHIPNEAQEFLNNNGELETVNDLYGLYSELGETAAKARRFGENQNFQKARIAEELRDAIWEDLQKISGSNVQLARAKKISALAKEQFGGDLTRKILGKTRQGESVIDPRFILDQSIGRGGQKGLVGFEQLRKATGLTRPGPITPQEKIIVEGTEDFLRNLFVQSVKSTKDESIDPRKAQAFLEKHRLVLSDPLLHPLRAQLESAKDLGDALRTNFKKAQDQYASRFATKGEKALGLFLNGKVLNRMQSIFSSGDPVGNINQIKELIRRTPISYYKERGIKKNEVVQGFKDSVFDYITQLGKTPNAEGLSELSLVFGNKEINAAFREILSTQDMARVRTYVDEVNKYNIYKSRTVGTGVDIGETPKILDQVIGTMFGGAVATAVAGPGQLAAAAFGKRTTIQILVDLRTAQMQKLLVDAFQDPKLFKSLLANPNSKAMGTIPAKRTYLGKYLLTNFFSDVSEKGLPLVGEGGDEAEMQASRKQDRPISDAARMTLRLINPFSEERQEVREAMGGKRVPGSALVEEFLPRGINRGY
tara:strand:- start:1112 stop:3946 length:2835 start_codon:yes stop_codon:yes gene_type:complete